MKVINIYGGPGIGKSTTASGLFHLMKIKNFNVEYVTEYAKDLTWNQSHKVLENQLYVFSKQEHRLRRLLAHNVEYIVTDSPLLLSIYYLRHTKDPILLPNQVHTAYAYYNNINILLTRSKKYNPTGRNQTEEEAIMIDKELSDILSYGIYDVKKVVGDEKAPEKILEIINGLE